MNPVFLIPETTVHAGGEGPALELGGETRPDLLLITLGITKVVEQEALLVSLHGSADGATWDPKPMVAFPQKFYDGISSVTLDLNAHREISHIRAQWKTARWGRGDRRPTFRIYLFAAPVPALTNG